MAVRADERIQRVLVGGGLILVGIFILLSLVPIDLLSAGLRRLFPSGNLVGPIGASLSGALVGAVGIGAAVVPLFLILWGALSLTLLERSEALRWTAFFGAIVLFIPPLVASFAYPVDRGPEWLAGRYGVWAGGLVGSALGWIGTALLMSGLFITALILTLGLGPFRAVARGAAAARSAGSAVVRGGAATARGGTSLMRTIASAWAQTRAFVANWLPGGRKPGLLGSLESRETAPAPPELALGDTLPAEPAPGEEGRKRRWFDLQDLGDPNASERPPLELLVKPPEQEYSVSEEELDQLGEALVEKLGTFRVKGEIAGRTTGPVVTQFEVVPASGVKVGKIAALSDDLALALKAPSIRIIAPIPGKGAVGVEVPNPERKVVYIRGILESSAYADSRAELPLALGEDVTGLPDVYDLARMPHLLIAGVTGSGKSVCINSIITSLIYRYTPEQLRLLLIDPKMVELGGYNILPHLRHPVVTDNTDAATVLKWLVYEMEHRYEWLSANGCRNLSEYNRRVSGQSVIRAPVSEGGERVDEPEILPYIVLIIDELADLMMTVQAEVERPLAYLAQKARATGIHLVVATQRPSVNVITGLIKANFPCRIAFRVASKVDSRTIIDQNGAETLLSNGDMLFLPPGESAPVRIQGAYVSTEDTDKLMDWYRARTEERRAAEQSEEDILRFVHERELQEAEADPAQEVLAERDPLFRRAGEVVVQHRQGSTSLLQRRLKVGYGRAARIVDQLENAGVVGPPDGSKPREILVTLEDLDRICSARNN